MSSGQDTTGVINSSPGWVTVPGPGWFSPGDQGDDRGGQEILAGAGRGMSGECVVCGGLFENSGQTLSVLVVAALSG